MAAVSQGAALVVLLDHLHPAAVPVLLGEVRPLRREDVRVDVDLEHKVNLDFARKARNFQQTLSGSRVICYLWMSAF